MYSCFLFLIRFYFCYFFIWLNLRQLSIKVIQLQSAMKVFYSIEHPFFIYEFFQLWENLHFEYLVNNNWMKLNFIYFCLTSFSCYLPTFTPLILIYWYVVDNARSMHWFSELIEPPFLTICMYVFNCCYFMVYILI